MIDAPLAAALQAHRDGREDEAEALYLALLDGSPTEPNTVQALLGLLYLEQANRLYALDRSDEAVMRYDAALALNSERADGWNNRGAALENLGRLDEALESFGRALALQAGYGQCPGEPWRRLHALGRWGEALADFDQAYQDNAAFCDQDSGYWNNRGIALHGLKRWGEAADDFARALDLNPANVGRPGQPQRGAAQTGTVRSGVGERGSRSGDAARSSRDADHPRTGPGRMGRSRRRWRATSGRSLCGRTILRP